MKTIELGKEDAEKLKAAWKEQQDKIVALREAQVGYNDADTKYKKLVLFFVAKNGGETSQPNGGPIAWEFVEEAGALIGVPQQAQQRMPQPQQQ